MNVDTAEAIAIDALSALAGDPEQLGRFLSLTGVGPNEIRGLAREKGFLAAVLDHVMSDEALLMSISANHGLHPAEIEAARIALGGAPPQ